MTKIVINNCLGGFSLSAKAVNRMAELEGKECFFFTSELMTSNFKLISIDETSNEGIGHWTAFNIPNPNGVLRTNKKWVDMDLHEKKEHIALYAKHNLSCRPEERDNPNLVQVVQELGKEADGEFAQLKVLEIPDYIEWEIEEYDGLEHIAEAHETRS